MIFTISSQKKEKIKCLKILSKAIIIYYGKKKF